MNKYNVYFFYNVCVCVFDGLAAITATAATSTTNRLVITADYVMLLHDFTNAVYHSKLVKLRDVYFTCHHSCTYLLVGWNSEI